MNQVNDTMLNMLQEMVKLSGQKKPAAKEDSPGSSFKDLMEQHQGKVEQDTVSSEKPAEEKPAEHTEPEQTEGLVRPVGDSKLEEQMALAAMALLANPVVPMEGQQPAAAETSAAPVAVQPEQAASMMPVTENAAATTHQKAAPQQPVVQQTAPQGAQEAAPELVKQQDGAVNAQQQVFDPKENAAVREPGRDQVPVMQEKDSDQTVEVEVMEPAQQKLFEGLKSVPVKVGEATASEQGDQTGSVTKQVVDSLAKTLKAGETKVEIQLKPHNLGTVKVEITRSGDGTLRVVLSAESSRTQALLEKGSLQLQSSLSNQNQEPVRVVVQQQENQQRADDQPNENHQGGRQQEQRQQHQQSSQDFLQQLRLGLVPAEVNDTLEERM